MKKALLPFLVCAVMSLACEYIVLPSTVGDVATPQSTAGWAAVVTNVGKSAGGDLHVDISIRNDTDSWSAMQAATGKPAVLTTADGKTANCDTVFVSTGGASLAPGFQMKGYTGGTETAPQTQLIYVECKGAAAAAGETLSIDYSYVIGDFNYYVASKATSAKLALNLDDVARDLKYPVATPVAGLIEKSDASIIAINQCVLTLTGVKRNDTGMELSWHTTNPTEYPTYVHIGIPPVIGSDGILYGFYMSPSLADAPITPAGQFADWTTQATFPKDDTGLYLLVSVETKQQKYFVNHAVDLTDK